MLHLWFKSHRSTLILILASLLSMGCVVQCGITSWDDQTALDRPAFHPPTPHGLAAFWYTPFMHTYMPFTQSLWWLAALAPRAFGSAVPLEAWAFHSLNLIAHTLAVLCAFFAVRLIVGDDRPAFVGALAIAVHPVQVESVAWISALNVVLAGMFTFATIWQYIRFARSSTPSRSLLHLSLAMLAFVLGLLSKPTTVAVPVILLVIDWMILKRAWKQIAVSVSPFVVLAMACAIWTSRTQTAATVQTLVSWPWRPLVALDALAFYLYKLLVPLWLGIDYGRTPRFVVQHPSMFVFSLFPIALAIWLFKNRHRAPLLAAGGAIFLAGLLPVLGFLPFDFQQKSTVADRYLYLPMFGVALAIAWAVKRYNHIRVFYVVAGVWILLSILQVQTWRDSIVLYQQQIAVRPNIWVGHGNLAIELAQVGRYDEAEREFEIAEKQFPNLELFHNHAKMLEDQHRDAEAARYYWRAIMQAPDLSSSWSDFARALAASGQSADARKAYEHALDLDSNNEQALAALKNLK
jgi:tetratricopeptide (TPR) repeat protein